MSCDRFELLIHGRIDGELGPEDAAPLDAHLAGCAACRRLLAESEAQDAELRRGFAPLAVGARDRGERRAAQFSALPRPHRRGRSALRLAAACVVAFGLGMWVHARLEGSAGAARSTDGALTPDGVPTTPRAVAHLTYSTGPVEILAAGTDVWQRLPAAGAVPAAAMLRSGPETRCELRAADGSVLRLDGGAEIRATTTRSWALERGRVWLHVARAKTRFEVRADDAIITALGTQFDVTRSAGVRQVNVFAGTTLVTRGDDARIVRPGERADIDTTIATRRAYRSELAAASLWMHELLLLKGAADAELATRLEDLLAGLGEQKVATLYEDEIRALGPSCVTPLLKFLQSEREQRGQRGRVTAAKIAAELATDAAIDDLILLLSDQNGDVRAAMATALQRLTGEDFGRTPEAWRTSPWPECEATLLRWVDWAFER